jgi:perosamine synthetase
MNETLKSASTAIPFGRPMLDDAEIAAVVRILKGTTLVHGPATHAFEQEFARRTGAAEAISVASCTAGLHLSLFVHKVGPEDRVAVPAMTHVATAHVVELLGATPVFVDVLPDSGNIDPAALEEAATGLKAMEVVHYLGLPCHMDAIRAIARKHGAALIEDCALSLGATYGGVHTGRFGAAGCFSFYPIKHMTTIEGGMVITDDSEVAARIRQAKAFGYDRTVGQRTRPGIYDVVALGFNYRMNEVEAAVGLTQLGKLDGFAARRERNYAELRAGLAVLDEVTVFAAEQGKAKSSHYCLNAVLPRDGRIDRDVLVKELNAAGVGTSVHYPSAVPLFSYYREKYGYRRGQFPIAEWLADQTISLPVGPHLDAGDPRRMVEAFKTALKAARQ